MRPIGKGQEPAELAAHRARPGAEYDGPNFTPVKDRIRDALLREQGFLCAYCMERIDAGTMKVEHWRSQTRHPAAQLDYRNLLGCCPGNEGQPQEDQHCDTHKGKDDLAFNPADPAHHPRLRIRYEGSGKVRSEDAEFDREINQVLNLNWHRLRENRKAVFKAVTARLSRVQGARTRPEIRRLLDQWQRPDGGGRLPGYCGVAVYYLERKLARM